MNRDEWEAGAPPTSAQGAGSQLFSIGPRVFIPQSQVWLVGICYFGGKREKEVERERERRMEERKDRDRCAGRLLYTCPFSARDLCEPGVCLPRAHGLEGGRQVRTCLGLCSGSWKQRSAALEPREVT